MKKNELKILWKKEKNEYTKHEIGSGVQNFVNEILMSDDIFKLKKGELSKKDSNRRNEFLLEKTKKQKRADIIIFITNDIIIPVEVEKYKNIKAGEQQIFNYQKAWNKKYGILTDGYTWRFYNNKIVIKEFTLDEILNKTNIFLTFWNEYTQVENYYLQFFEKTAEIFDYEDDLNLEENRKNFFDDITKLIDNFRKKLNLKGYFSNMSDQEQSKKSVEISYAYLIQFILYKTLADNDFHSFKTDLTERLKRVHKNLLNKSYGDILLVIKTISNNISKNIYKPFSNEQKIINQTLDKILDKPKNTLSEITPWLDIFIFIKQYNFTNIKNEIFGFIYENYLKQLYADKNKGQYFTAPKIVNFMLEEIGYSSEKLENKNEISIIDPSCGSGTFLYSAVRNIIESKQNTPNFEFSNIENLITDNVFGLDIEEFPLYLAEMSIIMKMLPLIINQKYNNPLEKKIKIFKTKDSIAEFLDVAIKNTVYDTQVDYQKNKQQMSLFTNELNLGYASYVRDEDDLKEMKQSLENKSEPRINRFRFDYIIGNPPYISFKQCSKLNYLFFQFQKEKKIRMNNIYGMNLHSIPTDKKKYAPNPNLYAYFIALGLALLKDNGKLSYIIPQTVLMAGDLDVIRYHLAKFTTIEKIIIFSNNMFIDRGVKQNKIVATSSLIFIVTKKAPAYLHETQIIRYKQKDSNINDTIENIEKNKNIYKYKISQNKLLKNVKNWNFLKFDKSFLEFYDKYKITSEDISLYYEHQSSKIEFDSQFYFDRGIKFPKIEIENKKNDNNFILPIFNKEKYSIDLSNKYIATEKLIFPFGSQGKKVFEQKYKIVWRYMNYDRFRFSDKKIMLDYNHIIISSDNKNELLYLFSLISSSLSTTILDAFFRNDNEKDILIGIKTIKKFIRIPKITERNKHIKTEIIKETQKILDYETKKLSDFVNFSEIMLQEFDNISTDKNNLCLHKNDKIYKLRINKNAELIELKFQNFKISKFNLQELKDFEIIDFEKIDELKTHINNLIFALYFNVRILQSDIKTIENVKNLCAKNKYYKISQ